MSADAAASILDQHGFTPKRFQAVQNRPMASSETDLYGEDDDSRPTHWSETAPPEDPRWDALRRARAENPLMRASMEAAGTLAPADAESAGWRDEVPEHHEPEDREGAA